jgi:hypothetical protein
LSKLGNPTLLIFLMSWFVASVRPLDGRRWWLGQHLGAPDLHGPRQPGQLGHTGVVGPVEGRLGRRRGDVEIGGGVDVAEQLAAVAGGFDLVPRASFPPGGLDALVGVVGELLAGDEQQLADVVERIALAAAMPEGLLLHSSADLIDHGVAEADDVEVIDLTCPSGSRRCSAVA